MDTEMSGTSVDQRDNKEQYSIMIQRIIWHTVHIMEKKQFGFELRWLHATKRIVIVH